MTSHAYLRSLVIALAGCGDAAPPADPPADPPAPQPLPGSGASQTVTLITGDRVTLAGSSAHVERGPGRDQVHFAIRQRGGDTSVIPSDMLPLVAARRLDAELFNVTRLLGYGYGDAERDDVPLIVSDPPEPASLHRRLRVDRTLATIRAAAVRQPKSDGGAAPPRSPRSSRAPAGSTSRARSTRGCTRDPRASASARRASRTTTIRRSCGR